MTFDKGKMKYLSAVSIYILIYGVYLSQTGAPMRVLASSATALLIGFLIPAIQISGIRELKRKKKRTLICITLSTVALSYMNSLVIAKAEFWSILIPMLPAGIIGLGTLIVLHAFITELLNRKSRTSRDSQHLGCA